MDMDDDEITARVEKLMSAVGDMPGDYAMEQLRVAFGAILARTQAEPDAGLIAFAAAATCITRALQDDGRVTVEVHICRPGRVVVYQDDGGIVPFDVGEDGDGRARVTNGARH